MRSSSLLDRLGGRRSYCSGGAYGIHASKASAWREDCRMALCFVLCFYRLPFPLSSLWFYPDGSLRCSSRIPFGLVVILVTGIGSFPCPFSFLSLEPTSQIASVAIYANFVQCQKSTTRAYPCDTLRRSDAALNEIGYIPEGSGYFLRPLRYSSST